ncbi:MAG: hypothetical protein J7497_07830 [Chitinophagaceae bacterium]|nr:hypothetical protein [Chitinophagaceae bacterium]
MLTTKPLILFCIFIAVTAISASCKKSHNPYSDNGLPPPTTTGQFMFACRVNGQPWIAKPGGVKAIRRNDSLIVVGTKKIEDLGFQLNDIFDTLQVDYQLTDTANSFNRYSKGEASDCFVTGPGYGSIVYRKIPNGTVHFTRTTGGIVSGTFSYYVPRDFCDTLFITDGRFDIKYYIYN